MSAVRWSVMTARFLSSKTAPPDELHLGARLPLVVENLFLAVGDVDERVARVVLGDELSRAWRDAELEDARPGVRRREPHAHGRRLAVHRQLHLLRPDDAPLVLDVERDRLTGVAGLRHDGIDHERRALERGARRGHPIDLHVARETVAADADGEHRHGGRLQGQERVGERRVGRVGAVAHEHHPRERQSRQLLARAVERRAEPRLRAGECQIVGRSEARRRRREAKRSQHEALRERLHQRRVLRAERLFHERAARLRAPIGNLHAAGVVDQHRQKVLLGNRRLHHENRAEQAEEQDAERRDAEHRQDDAIAQAAAPGKAAIGHDGDEHRRGREDRRDVRAGRRREAELSLLENDRPIFEEKAEQRVHVVSGASAPAASAAVNSRTAARPRSLRQRLRCLRSPAVAGLKHPIASAAQTMRLDRSIELRNLQMLMTRMCDEK